MTNQKSAIKNQQPTIKLIGVIGSGTMGSGIAQQTALKSPRVNDDESGFLFNLKRAVFWISRR